MTDIAALLIANLHQVFGERDAGARRSAIERFFDADVVFVDPEESVVGREALDAKAAGLIAGVPEDVTFSEDGPAYIAGNLGALAWRLGAPDAPIARGVDIITVRDGRIVELRTALAAS